jgi:hypothetical protein
VFDNLKDSGFQVEWKKRYKPIFICFVDLVLFLSHFFINLTNSWLEANRNGIYENDELRLDFFRNLVIEAAFLLKLVFGVVFIRLQKPGDKNRSGSTRTLFWNRAILDFVVYVVLQYVLKMLGHSLKMNTFVISMFLEELALYYICVIPAY